MTPKRLSVAIAAAVIVGGITTAIAWQFANPNQRDILGYQKTDDDCVGPTLPDGCDPGKPLEHQPACPKDAMPTCEPVPPVAVYGERAGYTVVLSMSLSMAALAFLFVWLNRPKART